jgi:outer membrane lipase/esterase
MAKFPANFALANITQPACAATTTLPDCSTQTLVTNSEGVPVNPVSYLWADKLHFGRTGHFELGKVAIARARNNPF